MKASITRRGFGKTIGAGVVGSIVGGSAAALASPPATSAPKRMTTLLRELISRKGIIAAPGIFDPMSARIAETLGFQVLDLPGSALGYHTTLMEPNLGLEDMVEALRRITSAVNVPVVVDVGAGFGEPAHLVRTVRFLEQAGAAGMHLEDQVYPKRFHYHLGQEHTISSEEMLDKIRYAVQARHDPDFVIVGRTDAFRTVSFAEGVRRSNLYVEAGADMIMPSHVTTGEQVKQLPHEIHAPLNWTHSAGRPGEAPVFSLQELEAMGGDKGGYKLINYVGGPIFAAFKAIKDDLAYLKQNGSPKMDYAAFAAIEKEAQEACNLPQYVKIENETTEKA
ncbi:MAG TPA: isocitrate lyase/PEP mutase family protein [Candidatus Acidoferrales bacterium]|nr:isocitrate lyase/PEP mutase family protein [Candidatus Acidoferrales bacterium]